MHRYMHAYAREVRVWEATADELLSRALVATLRDLRDAEVCLCGLTMPRYDCVDCRCRGMIVWIDDAGV